MAGCHGEWGPRRARHEHDGDVAVTGPSERGTITTPLPNGRGSEDLFITSIQRLSITLSRNYQHNEAK